MKCYLFICLSLVFSPFVRAEVQQQDIVFKSRFDLESSEIFLSQLRIFLGNNNFGDPYAQELKKPITLDLNKVLVDMPPDTQRWIRELQSVFKLQLFNSTYNLTIEKFGYSIKEFNTELKPSELNEKRVEFVTVSYVRGLSLHAERISFEVELKPDQVREPIKFKIEMLEPEFIVSPELTAELSMNWATSIQPKNLALTLDAIDIRKIMESVVKRPDLIDFKVKDIIIPNLSVKVGNKSVKFQREKINQFLVSQKNAMKLGILDILNVKLKERFANIIKDSPKNLLLDRIFKLNGDIPAVIDVQEMKVNKTGIVQIDFDGYFCKLAETNCKSTTLRRVIDVSQYDKSLREINRSLIEKKTNIAVSVSENYLNQLVDSTIRAGLWEEKLKGRDFSLGPEKAFILAEEKGEKFSLYLDIIYRLTGAQRILVGRSELRFPVKLMIGLNVEEMDTIPHFTIKVLEVATDNKLLLEGAPSYGLPSNVNSVPRFRSRVLSEIMEEVRELGTGTLIDFELQELKGTYLDELEFFSDGLGRGTATIGFTKSRMKR
jgi:hypothetical protein